MTDPKKNGHGDLRPGGQGDLIDPHHLRADLSALTRAITNTWDIPVELYTFLPGELLAIADKRDEKGNYAYGTRERLAAIRCLKSMHDSALKQGVGLGLLKPDGTVVNIQQNVANVIQIDEAALAAMSVEELRVLQGALRKLGHEQSSDGDEAAG